MPSSTSCRFYFSIMDDYSNFLWCFMLQSKSDVSTLFLTFLTNYFSSTILEVQTNGGGEFHPLKKILRTRGIVHRISFPYSHAQNGSIERRHRQITKVGLSLMGHVSVPQQY